MRPMAVDHPWGHCNSPAPPRDMQGLLSYISAGMRHAHSTHVAASQWVAQPAQLFGDLQPRGQRFIGMN